jgi:DNA-directed RNA polymerase specialized sigma24 family protein
VAESDAGEEFRRLFERSNRNLLAQAYLLTDDRQEAQDLVQEVFLRAWRAWP